MKQSKNQALVIVHIKASSDAMAAHTDVRAISILQEMGFINLKKDQTEPQFIHAYGSKEKPLYLGYKTSDGSGQGKFSIFSRNNGIDKEVESGRVMYVFLDPDPKKLSQIICIGDRLNSWEINFQPEVQSDGHVVERQKGLTVDEIVQESRKVRESLNNQSVGGTKPHDPSIACDGVFDPRTPLVNIPVEKAEASLGEEAESTEETEVENQEEVHLSETKVSTEEKRKTGQVFSPAILKAAHEAAEFLKKRKQQHSLPKDEHHSTISPRPTSVAVVSVEKTGGQTTNSSAESVPPLTAETSVESSTSPILTEGTEIDKTETGMSRKNMTADEKEMIGFMTLSLDDQRTPIDTAAGKKKFCFILKDKAGLKGSIIARALGLKNSGGIYGPAAAGAAMYASDKGFKNQVDEILACKQFQGLMNKIGKEAGKDSEGASHSTVAGDTTPLSWKSSMAPKPVRTANDGTSLSGLRDHAIFTLCKLKLGDPVKVAKSFGVEVDQVYQIVGRIDLQLQAEGGEELIESIRQLDQ